MPDPQFWTATSDGALVRVRLTPRASRSGIAGLANGRLRVRVTAPPVDSEANAALVKLIADRLDVPRSAVMIERGHKSRDKTLRITGSGLQPARLLED